MRSEVSRSVHTRFPESQTHREGKQNGGSRGPGHGALLAGGGRVLLEKMDCTAM